MILRIRKKVTILILGVVFVLGGSFGSVSGDITENSDVGSYSGGQFQKVAESGKYQLYVQANGEQIGEFYLLDIDSGSRWDSNPVGKESIEGAKGSARYEMYSQLIIYGYDEATNTERTVNSYTGTSRGESISVRSFESGFETTYTFDEDQLEVKLKVSLADGKLTAECDTTEIQEKGTFRVVRIAILPYFGSGGEDSDGYLVIPDGSGALIRFNNGKGSTDRFSMRIYGDDPSLAEEMKRNITSRLAFPIFGISRNKTGLLAVVTESAASANLNAQVAGQRNPVNTAYADFIIRIKDTVVVGESAATQTKQVIKYDMIRSLEQKLAVDYYPLDGGKFSYSDIAEKYRTVLIGQGAATISEESGIALSAEFFGGIHTQKTFLGIPYKGFEVLTSVDDVQNIKSDLAQNKIDKFSFMFSYWNKQELNGTIQTKVSPDRRLGILDEMYYSYSPFSITKSSFRFIRFFHSAKRLSREPVLLYEYKRSTNYRDASILPGYLPEMSKLIESAQAFISSMNRSEINKIYLSDIGNVLYTDFDVRNYMSRDELAASVESVLGNMNAEIIMEHPNAYALKYADGVVGIPFSHSRYDVEDEAIPFYQLVVSGLLPYASEAVNLSGDPDAMILKCLETGSDPHFVLTAAESSVIKETPLNRLYGADYERWKNFITSAFSELRTAFNEIGSRTIVSHELLEPGVTKSTYANGGSVIIDHIAGSYTINSGDKNE